MKVSYHPAAATLVAALALSSPADAVSLGTATVTNANHFGYYGFASTSANNTKRTIGPFTGVAKRITVSGTLTKVHPDAWAKSLRVLPSGTGLAVTQPWFQFSDQYAFTGTIPVSATIYAPGGIDASKPMNLEMYSIDSEGFVPGIDGRSTLTYTFESDFAPGTAEFSGKLESGDPTFNRPVQVETSPPGFSSPFLTNRFPYYDVQPFHVATAGSYTMVTANEFESAAAVYGGNFNPASPLSNLLRALGQTANVLRNPSFNSLPFDDDATGGTSITLNLTPGVQYFFVTTAFAFPGTEPDGGPFVGDYSNIITGAGNVTLGVVPEPGGMLLAILSIAVGTLRRRRVTTRAFPSAIFRTMAR